ncbi:keratin-associated protein 5-1-like isoform X2 [Amphibalanus amphitrite]|uniref:keratin-associated protein 5-1-like isoform X2 n=1 Tax=Amphibalanus amphitrite TaxID=1232801 RepID=UPI001C910BAB|nr:keratin-associated protein 5-1-like isoform X2 [Amphibalanus amphitrite]
MARGTEVPLGELHCSKGGSWCPSGETCGGPVCGPGPRCCDEAVDAFLQRPVLLRPPILPSDVKGAPPIDSIGSVREPPSTETANKPPPPPRRCRPGTKCIDNFPCEQGGSSCPSGQTCGGSCGPYTCCALPSSACGEGGNVCPAGYICRPCPLPGGACCFSSCNHTRSYIAEPCGEHEICLPCESDNQQLCCRPRPNTLESCRRRCSREPVKRCFLHGCPPGGGWCCRNPLTT